MNQPAPWRQRWLDHWLPWLIAALVFGWLVSLLSPILTPFAVAAALAYLGDPLVDRLEHLGLSRTLAVIVVFLFMTVLLIGLLLVLIPLLEKQVNYLLQRFPDYWNWFADMVLPWLNQRTGIDVSMPDGSEIIELLRQHWQSAGSFAAMLVSSVTQSGVAVIGWLVNITLIPVVTFYFLRDWDGMMRSIRELLPRSAEPVILRLAADANEVLSAFIRGQLLVMLALALIYAAGLALIGLKLALLIGLLAGLLSIVPYLGSIIGIAAALIAAGVQFGDWLHLLLAAAVFMVGQMLEGMVLTPWLVGDRIGLHPVAVIFAVMAGGILFGFLGVLLALPVAAVAMVLLRFAHDTYTRSYLYQGSPPTSAQVATDQPASAAAKQPPQAGGKPSRSKKTKRKASARKPTGLPDQQQARSAANRASGQVSRSGTRQRATATDPDADHSA